MASKEVYIPGFAAFLDAGFFVFSRLYASLMLSLGNYIIFDGF